jgi:hypothetical protein
LILWHAVVLPAEEKLWMHEEQQTKGAISCDVFLLDTQTYLFLSSLCKKGLLIDSSPIPLFPKRDFLLFLIISFDLDIDVVSKIM